MKPTLMLIGLGGLGSALLDHVARMGCLGRIVAAGRNATRGQARCNLARVAALAMGFSPQLEFLPLDLDQVEATAAAVDKIKPDIIFNAASLQAWWLHGLLPAEAREPLERARFGMWLPVHLALCMKLMRALRQADYRGVTLNAPFPDVVNNILGRLGLAPTAGVGNLEELVPKVQILAARRLRVPPESVRVTLVAHHALEPYAFKDRMGNGPPFFLRISAGNHDVRDGLNLYELLFGAYSLPSGPVRNLLTAACSARLIAALCQENEVRLHVPGPHGLPGGYPVRVRRGKIQTEAIDGLPLEQAISINEQSHPFDGIEKIEPDGTAVFCAMDAEALREALGYDCPRLAPQEAGERATELMKRFREYAGRFGVDPDRYAAAGIY